MYIPQQFLMVNFHQKQKVLCDKTLMSPKHLMQPNTQFDCETKYKKKDNNTINKQTCTHNISIICKNNNLQAEIKVIFIELSNRNCPVHQFDGMGNSYIENTMKVIE